MQFGKTGLGSTAIAAVASLSLLTACAQGGLGGSSAYGNSYGNGTGGVSKGTVGTLAGGAGGALLGAQFGKGKGQLVGVALGTLLGAAVGNSVGNSLDKADVAYAERATQSALEQNQPGQPLPWTNSQTGVTGTVIPSNYYQTAGGQYCREYTQNINIGGRSEQGVGRACRQPDGTWQVVQ